MLSKTMVVITFFKKNCETILDQLNSMKNMLNGKIVIIHLI